LHLCHIPAIPDSQIAYKFGEQHNGLEGDILFDPKDENRSASSAVDDNCSSEPVSADNNHTTDRQIRTNTGGARGSTASARGSTASERGSTASARDSAAQGGERGPSAGIHRRISGKGLAHALDSPDARKLVKSCIATKLEARELVQELEVEVLRAV
jgi:hypothetical protein